MISEKVFRDKIISVVKKLIDTDPFFKHFEDYIKAVFIDHGDKFIVFTHSAAKAGMAGGFQYPNKIYIDKNFVEREIAKRQGEDVLSIVLFLLLRHELRHFIQCVVMIDICNNFEEAEKCWKSVTRNREIDPLELDVYSMEHGEDKSIEEFYDFINGLIEEYCSASK